MEETPESLYAKRFLEEKLGSDIVALAKKVLSSGIRLTHNDVPIPGDTVVEIGAGHKVMSEEDLRTFHSKVQALGEYNENSGFRVISDFLSATPVLVEPQEEDPAPPVTAPLVNS